MDLTEQNLQDLQSRQDMQGLVDTLGSNSADQEKLQNLRDQIRLAQQLRGFNMPRGEHIPGYMGGVYVAPSALQDLGSAAGDVMSYRQGQSALGQAGDMANAQQASRTKMLAAILRSRLGNNQQDPQLQDISVDQQQQPPDLKFGIAQNPYDALQYITPGS